MMENKQRRDESVSREAGFSTTLRFGRNDKLWVVGENEQQQRQPQVLRLAHSRAAQDDKFLDRGNS